MHVVFLHRFYPQVSGQCIMDVILLRLSYLNLILLFFWTQVLSD